MSLCSCLFGRAQAGERTVLLHASELDASPHLQKGRKEETPGQTQDMRERLHLPLGWGTPQPPPRGDGGSSRERTVRGPVFAAESAAPSSSDAPLSRHSLCRPGKPKCVSSHCSPCRTV